MEHEKTADKLISQMTLSEKLSQLLHDSPAIPRLGIKRYNWWNECLHGVARAGIATVFPQAIGLAAMFDKKTMGKVARAISDEAREKHHLQSDENGTPQYFGLNFWSPNINIFRDPRWGRGQETYGECPYLTSVLAVEFIKGLQGDNPEYLKTAACAKHFAVHSGPENMRHGFNAAVSKKDLFETYLPAFEAAVKEAKVETIMTAYNAVNGEPCSASDTMLNKILRERWGFKGHVVSDCGAIDDIYLYHKKAADFGGAMALALENGCDMNCCNDICTKIRRDIFAAGNKGLFKEEWVNRNLKRILITRLKLGLLGDGKLNPYANFKKGAVDSNKHRALSLKCSRDSLVLLKNNGILPLSNNFRTIAVIGPNCDDIEPLLGNYSGTPSSPVTPLKALKAVKGIKIIYAKGCEISDKSEESFFEALNAAKAADAVVMCMGLSPKIEGEETDTNGHERETLGLPGVQEKLLKKIKKLNKPVILVLMSGGAVSVEPKLADAVIQAWYPGQSGGTAVAELIFGKFSPSGKLPVTVYKSEKDLPVFENYEMKGRTYRYFEGKPLYPFGYGLSYAKFVYFGLRLSKKTLTYGQYQQVYLKVKNVSGIKAAETVQLYIKSPLAGKGHPKLQLAGFEKVILKPGQTKKIKFEINPKQIMLVNDDGEMFNVNGTYTVFAGGTQPGYEKISPHTKVLKASFNFCGQGLKSNDRNYMVYMLRCGNGSIYTGMTNDIKKRLKQHNSGRGAQYTKIHRPLTLIRLEKGYNIIEAMRREREIKRMPKDAKEKLASEGRIDNEGHC